MTARPAWLSGVRAVLRPAPRLGLSEWAARHFFLSAESSAIPGRFRPYAYQIGILDAFTDPAVEWITWMKSARLGATKILGAAIGYFIQHDPSSMLVVQPTLEDARGWSKEELAPMLRDIEVLTDIVGEPTERSPDQTILQRMYPGGVLSIVGANSARGFRRITRRCAFLDEVDGYPPSAGNEGDPIELAVKRTETFFNRKIATVSTPTIAGISKIEPLFEAGDRRRYHVPCPHCGVFDFFVFRPREDGRGHVMRWPKDEPERAYFECSACRRAIHHHHKREMVEAGEWKAEAPFRGHASFHLWAAYSFSPNATWGHVAERYSKAARSGDVEKLKTVVNTDIGETWKDKGEAPDWQRLFNRRGKNPLGIVPVGVRFLTAGVDVQRDRLMAEVTGWNERKESWLVDRRILFGDTSSVGAPAWVELDKLLAEQFPCESGGQMSIASMGVDSGDQTQVVYNWCRRYPIPRVIATKGMDTVRTLVGSPSPVDVNVGGERKQNLYRIFPVGVDIAKSEFYGWLGMNPPDPGPDGRVEFPDGWCHFPDVEEGYFKQITAEQKITVKTQRGYTVQVWRIIANRENHWLDTRIISRAAASVLGLDRYVASPPSPGAVVTATPAAPRAAAAKPSPFTGRAGRSPFVGRRGSSPFSRRR